MSRTIGAKCKLCRREGTKLFLKGERCYSEKCALNRKPFPPGKTAYFRTRTSTYGLQLREKQKVKRVYGLNEAQFKNILEIATKRGGDKGLRLLQLLEMRLDNVVYLLGLAPSRASARQAISHGMISVNDDKMTIPSYRVDIGDVVSIRSKKYQPVSAPELKSPGWLKKSSKGGEVVSEPSRDMIDEGIKENMIIEFYSR